jgi:hypothetical protein
MTNAMLKMVARTADVGNFSLEIVANTPMFAKTLIENKITVTIT